MRVYVLVFNAGTENEGIHTIRLTNPTEPGVVRNKILMFESEDDATRFSLMLEAQDFPTPSVEAIDAEEIKEFCASAGYDWELVLENSDLVVPPEINVEETDWDSDTQINDTSDNEADPELSELPDAELDNIRRKLEGLL